MTSKLLLEGRKAIITGAANGIGFATAVRFGAEGAAVALLDCEPEPVRRAAASISGGQAFVVDVRDECAVEAAVAKAEQALSGIDIVIANAAIEPPDDDRADRLAIAVWRRVIDTNLTGVFLTAKFGLKALLRSSAADRVLICTVSPTGIRGSAPGQDAYSTSKAGVLGLMRVMANDYAADGIRVNGVMPGFTDTRANAAIFADPAKLAAVNASVPLGRAGTPAEVAALMAWVASSEARYATGAVFVVDGGMTAI
jgi:NAD(P)-dependent dehydrogenase (short-subunit alcohol dehydrogenase family)